VTSGEQEDPDLLIRQGLSVSWPVERGERLLNLKNLLTVIQPSLERVFENGAILRPLFLRRNRTKFRDSLPKRGRMRHEIAIFRNRFYHDGPGLAKVRAICKRGFQHRGAEAHREMRNVWKQTTSHVIFSLFLRLFLFPCLCVSAFNLFISSALGAIPTMHLIQIGRRVVTGFHERLAGWLPIWLN